MTTYDEFRKMDKNRTLSDIVLEYMNAAGRPCDAQKIKYDMESLGFFESEIRETLDELEKNGKLECRYVERFRRLYGLPEERKC